MIEVFSGITPYDGMDVNKHQITLEIMKGLRPDTSMLPPSLANLVYECWNDNPRLRPSFSEIIYRLRRLRDLPEPALPLRNEKKQESVDNIYESEESEESEEEEEDESVSEENGFDLGVESDQNEGDLKNERSGKKDWYKYDESGVILSTDFEPLSESIQSGKGVPFSLN